MPPLCAAGGNYFDSFGGFVNRETAARSGNLGPAEGNLFFRRMFWVPWVMLGVVMHMRRPFSILLLLLVAVWPACTTVQSTAQYYLPYSTQTFPPKPKEAEIPILGKAPAERHTAIGRLKFETDRGWRFLRRSMEYNARVHGADAVVLKAVSERRQMEIVQVPPRVDWVPAGGYYQKCENGRVYGYTNWVPIFQPGYTFPVIDAITGIDAEMIVLKK